MNNFERARDTLLKKCNISGKDRHLAEALSDWAYAWCEDLLVTDLHRQRLFELDNCKITIKRQKFIMRELTEALDFYTRHPVYWDKDINGHLIPEGPSKVAVQVISKYRGEINGKAKGKS